MATDVTDEVTEQDELTLPQLALYCGLTWHQAYNALLSGDLVGYQRAGRWYVSRRAADSFKAKH